MLPIKASGASLGLCRAVAPARIGAVCGPRRYAARDRVLLIKAPGASLGLCATVWPGQRWVAQTARAMLQPDFLDNGRWRSGKNVRQPSGRRPVPLQLVTRHCGTAPADSPDAGRSPSQRRKYPRHSGARTCTALFSQALCAVSGSCFTSCQEIGGPVDFPRGESVPAGGLLHPTLWQPEPLAAILRQTRFFWLFSAGGRARWQVESPIATLLRRKSP